MTTTATTNSKEIRKCDRCSSTNLTYYELEANPGGCGDPECCGVNYFYLGWQCNDCNDKDFDLETHYEGTEDDKYIS